MSPQPQSYYIHLLFTLHPCSDQPCPLTHTPSFPMPLLTPFLPKPPHHWLTHISPYPLQPILTIHSTPFNSHVTSHPSSATSPLTYSIYLPCHLTCSHCTPFVAISLRTHTSFPSPLLYHVSLCRCLTPCLHCTPYNNLQFCPLPLTSNMHGKYGFVFLMAK